MPSQLGNPSAGSSVGGAAAVWSPVNGAFAQGDSNTASAPFSSLYTQTQTLEVQGYGFTIPGGATIVGVEVTVWRSKISVGTVSDLLLNLYGTFGTSSDKSLPAVAWPSSNNPQTYGSPSDLWGVALTPTMVNDSGFGVALAAQNTVNTGQAIVDWMGVTVYYSIAGIWIPIPQIVRVPPEFFRRD
jgi:hypothetical protein